MMLNIANTIDLVGVFEARLIGIHDATLAIACGSMMNCSQ